MHQVNLEEAKILLAELIDEVVDGEEVVIQRQDGAAFRIVPIAPTPPIPKFGSARGLVKMADDFDEPLADFEEYAP
jgi:prevent-host-death family protein